MAQSANAALLFRLADMDRMVEEAAALGLAGREDDNGRQLTDELNNAIQFPGLTNAWTMPIKTRIDMLSTGIKTRSASRSWGDDLQILSDIGEQIEALVRDIARDTLSAFSERVVGGNYLDFDIDRAEVARYGLTVGDVQDIIQSGHRRHECHPDRRGAGTLPGQSSATSATTATICRL